MDSDRNVSERGKDLVQKKKKKRGGTKFSAPKALKRSAMQKRSGSCSNGDERTASEFEGSEDEEPHGFRRNLKIRTINLETVMEVVSREEEDAGEEWKDMLEENVPRRQYYSSSDSLSYSIADDGGVESRNLVRVEDNSFASLNYYSVFIEYSICCLDW